MSRSNPEKRPRRAVKSTALIVVEGETEEAFCKYLKIGYNRDCGLAVRIHNAHGLGPDSIIDQARRQCYQKSFDRVFVLIDEDLDIALVKSQRTIRSLKIGVWRSRPQCIEGFFLSLLRQSVPATSKECKETFHRLGLSEREKLEWESYTRILPYAYLEEVRSSHPHLDNLIKLFSNEL